AVLALHGKVSSQDASSYLVTAGTDRCIRSWDFVSPQRCYILSGREPTQPLPVAEYFRAPAPSYSGGGEEAVMCLFRGRAAASPETLPSSHAPLLEERGLLPPRTGHDDAVLDLKMCEAPVRMLLSSGRDGVVKVWR
ncbi:unnamed protein product, partial [Phaeothamnion confervicola]